jgi:RNA polymerase-binding transcription factor DksA
MGPRELARAIELNQQYVELLEELETMDFGICESASVEVIL